MTEKITKKPKPRPKKEKKPKAEKKDTRTLTEKMRDHLRASMKDETAADTFEGDGLSSVREVMPTRLDVLDHGLIGIGGLPYGRIIEISGAEDTGKSSLVNHLIWAAQQDGAVASLGDAERKVQPNWVDVFKVDRKAVLLLPARTVEEYLQELAVTIKKYKRTKIVFFLDSVATTQPQKALDEDLTENEIPGAMAAAWSRGLRSLNPLLSESRSMLVLVNQVRCVSEDELVITDQGITTAGDAKRDKEIAGYSGQLTPISASAASSQIAYRVLLKDGRYLSCGAGHPVLLTKNGKLQWVKAKEVRGGDWVAIPRKVELPDVPDSILPRLGAGDPREVIVPVPIAANEDFCSFLGMWFSDGSLLLSSRDKALVFGERSKDRGAALVQTAETLGWKPSRFGPWGYRFGSRIVRLLESIGCQVGGGNKDIPAVITGRRQWRAFLRGMFDSHPASHGFYLTIENRLAARKVQLALLGFGVYSRAAKSRTGSATYLYVAGADAARYVKEIGFVEKEKEARVLREVGIPDESSRGKGDTIPGVSQIIAAAMKSDSGKSVSLKIRYRLWAVARADLNVAPRDYVEAAEGYGLSSELAAFRWVQVKQVFKGKVEVPMIDFDVPDGRAFIAGGIVTHNSVIGNMYGPTESTAAGRALKYYLSLRLSMYHGQTMKDGAVPIGKWSKVSVGKNHLSLKQPAVSILLKYATGWDNDRSTMMYAREVGAVDKKERSVKVARQCLHWPMNEAEPDVLLDELPSAPPPAKG